MILSRKRNHEATPPLELWLDGARPFWYAGACQAVWPPPTAAVAGLSWYSYLRLTE